MYFIFPFHILFFIFSICCYVTFLFDLFLHRDGEIYVWERVHSCTNAFSIFDVLFFIFLVIFLLSSPLVLLSQNMWELWTTPMNHLNWVNTAMIHFLISKEHKFGTTMSWIIIPQSPYLPKIWLIRRHLYLYKDLTGLNLSPLGLVYIRRDLFLKLIKTWNLFIKVCCLSLFPSKLINKRRNKKQ